MFATVSEFRITFSLNIFTTTQYFASAQKYHDVLSKKVRQHILWTRVKKCLVSYSYCLVIHLQQCCYSSKALSDYVCLEDYFPSCNWTRQATGVRRLHFVTSWKGIQDSSLLTIPIDYIFSLILPLCGKQIGWTQQKCFIPDIPFLIMTIYVYGRTFKIRWC